MFTIFKDHTFAAAHAIRGHRGECRHLHGHNYRVRVHVTAGELDEIGMVTDFADLKELVAEVLGPFDHRVINEIPPFDEINTTAERIAEYAAGEVDRRLIERFAGRVRVTKVEVWENESSCAIYRPAPGGSTEVVR